ncbi:uncharacterized protein LAESUDRAFT_727155 [Laetiporus sulphureus 93-53]|uniref:choline-phosphate cytidylyltransferase n=1 Tax=Laetiporus sulphureus 93-53 TaxID=1314785 RepID=A0A165DMQ0_9APHY|nr:uncharacterized protein LAESUDRAFT_727155 [Laetiporus sulphureus 93-53]KZT05214.1 hypothetical protein LAESUDRAFT_727155 [Laetiporus sulphureus 93-53]
MSDILPPKRTLHSKRSFGTKHAAMAYPHGHRQVPDSPAAYDASEEDNDPLTDDAASAVGVPVPSRSSTSRSPVVTRAGPRARLAALVDDGNDTGTDSPTYDGDIESSTTLARHYDSSSSTHYAPSPVSTLTSPLPTPAVLPDPAALTLATASSLLAWDGNPSEPAPAPISVDAFNPAELTPEDIQEYVRRAIAREGEENTLRKYKINPPPKDRPARIYADGVYDLFHFGHALQLRQAKLSFPPIPIPSTPTSATHRVRSPCSTPSASSSAATSPLDNVAPAGMMPGVYLLVGVNSDEQCEAHKNMAVMSHAERCEAVRHCRWVDEVVPEAPWVIDEAFLQKYQIDYVAHDEDPYVSAGIDDVYGYCKSKGKFIPTRRTPGVSTSELLERIVSRYRMRIFDKKLAKIGHPELMAEGSDYDGSAPDSLRVSRAASPGLFVDAAGGS